jgi:hypothetical protein
MKKHIGLSLLLLIVAFNARAQNLGGKSDCTTNPPDFVHLSYEEANKAVYIEERKTICPEYITNLVNQLRQGHLTNDNKTLAIFLLGTFRPTDTNSIEVLIENIDFRASKIDPLLGPARWGFYPAQEALIKIGSPTVNPILNHLPNETNELRLHLMCEVLRHVEGKEAAHSQIKKILADKSDSAKHANLEAALKELEK